MYQITKLAEAQGLTLPGTSGRIRRVLQAYGLPTECGILLRDLAGAAALDKKNLNSRLNLVLLHEIGSSYLYSAETDFLSRHGGQQI